MNTTRREPADRDRSGGFTLIELLVVMGILTGFLLMLVQLVEGGLDLFREGEVGQDMADRAARAQRIVRDELSLLRGSSGGPDRERADDRLVVQLLPIGLPLEPERNPTLVQVLRGAVHLSPRREVELIERSMIERVATEQPELSGEALVAEVQRRIAAEPMRGIGNLLLLPWRQRAADDALLELRAAWFLPGQRLPIGRDRSVDPFEVVVPGSSELPGIVVQDNTTVLLRDLLHIEFAMWGQRTTSWGDGHGPRLTSGSGSDPLWVWDSARAGWLTGPPNGGQFPFDRGPASAGDTSDDVHPHAILVRCVVAQDAEIAPEGLLASFLGADDTNLLLADGNRFPGADDGGFVKLDGEWMRYAAREGDVLIGLRRGARLTKNKEHERGTRVHVGRTVEFVVPVLHGKDDWNG